MVIVSTCARGWRQYWRERLEKPLFTVRDMFYSVTGTSDKIIAAVVFVLLSLYVSMLGFISVDRCSSSIPSSSSSRLKLHCAAVLLTKMNCILEHAFALFVVSRYQRYNCL